LISAFYRRMDCKVLPTGGGKKPEAGSRLYTGEEKKASSRIG